MVHSDTEYVWFIVFFFFILGLAIPYITLEFGGTVASFDVENVGEAGILGVINAITSVLFWTFGVNVYINFLLLMPLRIIMWYILFKQINPISSGT